MTALSLASLKSYVSADDRRAVSSTTALLDVHHSLIQQRFVEIPFDLAWTIDDVKHKIYTLCGTQPEHQQLHLNSAAGPLITQQAPHTTLASYGVRGGGVSACCLFVIDCNPFALGRHGGLHDVSLVAKYEMSEDEYSKRQNTYRAYKQKMRAANPHWRSIYEGKATPAAAVVESEDEIKSRCLLNSRCQIAPGDRRGIIRYVGAVPELCGASTSSIPSTTPPSQLVSAPPRPLLWVGVELDEPRGSHSGSVRGVAYFTCRARHGVFVKPSNVTVGQFPEIDPFDDEDDADEALGAAGAEQAAETGRDAEDVQPSVVDSCVCTSKSQSSDRTPGCGSSATSVSTSTDLYEEL